ncbi:DegV family protein [Haploplasma axanthum]|uniref:EDD domain-containing protein, DegV family n=1 Tax=Haploplasma axanthum TaxID=29552 RepID=A0A449BC63_HAPAX|nr:DegV family protein [Haploplasma axanthum]VEU80041.1 EDD domain-containing protein, DegV family [Haploplasma axanthum]
MKIKVATTSTGCLDYYNEPHDIDIVRIKLLCDGKELLDGKDITADEFYERLRTNPEWVPKTSQPSIGEMVEYFEDLANRGYTHVFVTTISSLLSGTYNSLYQASQIVADKIDVTVYDTKTVCFSEGYFALQAKKMFELGMGIGQVIEKLDHMKENNTIFFAVDSLTQLVNNGRLSGAKAFFGKLLKIKPILQVQGTGEIVAVEKTRNIKKALKKIADNVKEYTKGREFFAHILYAGDSELKDYFLEILKDELGIENLYEAPSTPVVGAHIGPDVIGIGIFLE